MTRRATKTKIRRFRERELGQAQGQAPFPGWLAAALAVGAALAVFAAVRTANP